MKERKTGNNQYLKEMNKSIVLDLIRTTKGIGRKALADITGLSATASGGIVKTLLQENYIQEIGEGESSGGRKPVMLELKPGAYFSLGYDIDVRFIYTVVMDMTGSVVHKKKQKIKPGMTAEQAIAFISQDYKNTIDSLKLPESSILGVGISIPGMLERETKRIILAPNLGWANVDILKPLEQLLNTRVYLDNEAICSAFCENWVGLCQGMEDFICINVESGIGAGLFLGGKVYRGFSGSAGEVGHISVDENGPKCKCGNVGCLETIASVNGMVARSLKTAALDDDIAVEATFEALVEKAKQGDEESRSIIHEAAVSIGKATAILINTFNPQKIVLGKKFPEYADLALETIRTTAEKLALPHPVKHVEIASSRFGEDSSALGAAIIPIRKLFGR